MVLLLLSAKSYSGEADVVDVKYQCKDSCSFAVTVRHDDDGWKHYANRWEIQSLDGEILATRVLAHPHEKQPFTRSLSNIKFPKGTTEVIVRAHDMVHGYGGLEVKVKIK